MTKGSCNLKKTLAGFAALSFEHFEQYAFISNRLFGQVLKDQKNLENLVTILFHLQNETFKDQDGTFKQASTAVICDSLKQTFTNMQVAALESNMVLILYLCRLYIRTVIDNEIILCALGLLIQLPAEIGNPPFAEMFLSLEEKLKIESKTESYQFIVDHMKNKVIGDKEASTLPWAMRQWLKKLDLERENATKTFKDKREAAGEMGSSGDDVEMAVIKEAVEYYCFGARSLTQTLRIFERYKSVSSDCLGFIPHECLAFVMATYRFHRPAAILLKNFLRKTFKERSEELYKSLFGNLQFQVKEYFQYTSAVVLEGHLCLVKMLVELFEEEVIDEVLIVESLDMFVEDWGGAADDCFTEMFTKVCAKLKPKISEEKFQEFTEHLEDYIFEKYEENNLPLSGRQYLERKIKDEEKPKTEGKPTGAKAKAVSQKAVAKKHPPKKIQRIIINLLELEADEKMNEVVENLQNILKSENRKKNLHQTHSRAPKIRSRRNSDTVQAAGCACKSFEREF